MNRLFHTILSPSEQLQATTARTVPPHTNHKPTSATNAKSSAENWT